MCARKREWGLGQIEAMVPLCPQRAGEAEVDWGQAWVNMAGKPRKVHLFIMRPRQSGKPFVRAYPNEAQEMFFDGHLHAFTYFGGVFPVLIYDNLKTAVKRVFRGRQREQQHQFRAFRAHYTFEAHFCNPARGNEKGGVEGLVDYARKNLLVPIPEVADFEELNQLLLAGCERLSERRLAGREDSRSIAALFAEEQTSLMPLPTQPFAADTQWSAKVDKYQTVRVNRVRYSVPTEYVGLRVWVSQGCQKVEVRFGTKLIATHSRGFRADCWVLDPLHYLGLLERKIRAMANARPIRAWQERWPPSHDLLWRRLRERLGEREGSRAFLRVLMLYQHHPQEQVEMAIAQALERGFSEVESIRPLLTGAETAQACQRLPAERLPASCPGEHEPPNPAQYDRLAGGL